MVASTGAFAPTVIDSAVLDIDEIVGRVEGYHPDADVGLIRRAYHFSQFAHREQTRKSGDPFFIHPARVASIITDLRLDTASVCAGLLHDVIEDTDTTYDELVHEFTKEIADLVMEVTHEGTNYRDYYFPRLESRKGIMIQFADRLSNMARMRDWPGDVQQWFLDDSCYWRKSPMEMA